ncbi:MAG: hypothetical protein KC422_16375 [Trueperaceae bacterium]|nr:hypothetical protein [Trueperaceae bacterium]
MVSDSVKEAWQDNTKINKVILDHLTPEMVHARTPGEGFTVAEHLLEILHTPKYFGLKFNEEKLGAIPNLYEVKDNEYIAETDLGRIREVAQQTAVDVLEAAEAADSKGELPHTNLDMYLIHMMVHDAHHRGQLLLALKTNGFPLPSEDLVWGPWKNQ